MLSKEQNDKPERQLRW